MEFFNPIFAGTTSLKYVRTHNHTVARNKEERIRDEWFPSFVSATALPERNLTGCGARWASSHDLESLGTVHTTCSSPTLNHFVIPHAVVAFISSSWVEVQVSRRLSWLAIAGEVGGIKALLIEVSDGRCESVIRVI